MLGEKALELADRDEDFAPFSGADVAWHMTRHRLDGHYGESWWSGARDDPDVKNVGQTV